MGDAVTLIVLVAAGAARDPTTVAMTGATRDALGGAIVEVRETRSPLDDDAALTVETSAHADAVVELGWADRRHRQATLRLHIAAGRRWIERVIRFTPSDAYAERGRTLGFAVASMLPEAAADRTLPLTNPTPGPPANPTATPTPAPTPTPSPTATAQPPAPPESSPAPPKAATPAPAPPPPGPPSAAPTAAPPVAPPTRTSESATVTSTVEHEGPAPELAVDLRALGAIGIAGTEETVGGGSAAVQWFVLHTVSLRLAGAVRAGRLDSQSSTLTFYGAAGLVWQAWRPTPSFPVGLSLRADYVLLSTKVTDPHGNPNPQTFGIKQGADTLVEAAVPLTADTDVVVGLGVDGTFFEMEVVDASNPKGTTLPRLSAVGEIGFRLRF